MAATCYSSGITLDHDQCVVIWPIGTTALRLDIWAAEDVADLLKEAATTKDPAALDGHEYVPYDLAVVRSGSAGVRLQIGDNGVELTAEEAHDTAEELYEALESL